ncbi:hypothetical protein AQUCO_00500457v1 [Aquilegia coerulea]|uniref:Uncharacterized protein n=1 Tax=Aquilegia coerulea TaxID=218851 RepID=A0A2G5ES50_AQUCA|nr:hypothetical protein AQUCO_00500457v1 [Aquilegia coerulea]
MVGLGAGIFEVGVAASNINVQAPLLFCFCSISFFNVQYNKFSTIRNIVEANLNILLSSISNNATLNNTKFYNTTVGTSPNIVYGIFQCRGDLTSEDCKRCAEVATGEIKIRCPDRKEITIWYDDCWLRVSNKLIISIMANDPKKYFSYANNVSNPNLFRSKLNELMDGLVDKAVNSTDLFAVDEQLVANSDRIYGLVQCTQDITSRECGRCLTTSVNQITPCCNNKDGGRILKPTCILWFEVYKFFQSEVISRDSPGIGSSPNTGQEKKSSEFRVIIVVPSVIGGIILSTVTIFFCIRKNKGFGIVTEDVWQICDDICTVESLQFNFGTVYSATDSFSDSNKLGEGGFGAVYKGSLSDGRDIAVKRLSKNSCQGVEEFKNEVLLLAKLQHRNLVRLLGFCLQGDEKLLIYEFVSNASLDKFIFDPVKRTYLDWEKRYKIIVGISRGLLYLHEDSRDTIIHRDLKASNILLDAQMNPKISDFGMARLFVVDQTQGSTSKIVGTYGYMAPEYLMQGHFSVKSDVFSFGVLVLEIITGQKNNSYSRGERAQDLLSHAWRQSEVRRCIQIGLLCVQEDVGRRPTMASVALMLSSYTFTLPVPSAPAFFVNTEMGLNRIPEEHGTNSASGSFVPNRSISSSNNDASISSSNNDASITELLPR